MKTLLLIALATTVGIGRIAERVEVRIEGFLDGTREEIHPWQMFQVRVGEGNLHPFALTNVIVLTAGSVSGGDIVAQVQPIRPNFIFAGGDDILEKIRTAKPNEMLHITGYTNLGSQWVLVNRVERSAPIVEPTPSPTLRQRFLGF